MTAVALLFRRSCSSTRLIDLMATYAWIGHAFTESDEACHTQDVGALRRTLLVVSARRVGVGAFCALVVVFLAAWSWVPFGFSPLGVPNWFVIVVWGVVAVAGLAGIVQAVFSDEEWASESWDGSAGESKAVSAAVVAGLYLLIVGCFAMIYLQVASKDSHAFRGTVDQIGAAYFAVDSFTTTGFGDIAPQNHLVRVIVSVQELVGLALIAVAIAALAARLLEKNPEAQHREPASTKSRKAGSPEA